MSIKRTIIVLLVFSICIGICGCGSQASQTAQPPKSSQTAETIQTPEPTEPPFPTIEETIISFCEAMKAFDERAMNSYVASDANQVSVAVEDVDEIAFLYDFIKDNAAKIEYEIIDANEDGDSGKATVRFKYVDTSEVAANAISNYFVEAIGLAFSGSEPSDEELQEIMKNAFTAAIESTKTGEGEATAVFEFIKGNDRWLISKAPEEIQTIILGNMDKTFESLDESWGSSDSTEEAELSEVTIEEAVVFDQNDIKITVKSLNTKGSTGPEIKLLIENNSTKNISVQARNTSVNGYMTETFFSADVAAGKKANDKITLYRSDLNAAGITTIADIELSFHIFDSGTWDTIYDSEPVCIKTSASEGFEYFYDDSGNQVYNDKDVQIVVKGLAENKSILLYIYNSNKKDITVQARDFSINGFMIDPYFSCDVVSGKHAITTITFLSSELEENEIEAIETVELSFHIYDMETWDTIVDTAPITINFDQ
jgi:hypothetical protein